jgi:hypothetical protein
LFFGKPICYRYPPFASITASHLRRSGHPVAITDELTDRFQETNKLAPTAGMVKGFGRCLAYESHPCRNPRSVCTWLWVFLVWRCRVRATSRSIWRGAPIRWTSSGRHLSLSGGGIDEFVVHDDGRRGAGREPSRRRTIWRSRLSELIMPGHEWSPGLEVSRSAGPVAGTMRQRSR